jgi:hypothetical protein
VNLNRLGHEELEGTEFQDFIVLYLDFYVPKLLNVEGK